MGEGVWFCWVTAQTVPFPGFPPRVVHRGYAAPPDTSIVEPVNIVLFDMGRLRYRRNGDRLEVHARHLGLLADTDAGDEVSSREAVFAALDELLRSFRLPVGSEWCRAGLYNPITRQVAIGEVPNTRIYQAPHPVGLEEFGTVASFEGESLFVGESELLPYVATSASAHAVLAAH